MKKAKILVRKGKKQFIEDLDREVTTVRERRFYIYDFSRDFSTPYGMIRKEDLKKTGVVTSSQNKEFNIFDASFIDDYKRIRRLPQIIPLKDIGYIIAKTGIGPGSIVVEGGTGSGALAIMLARVCKQVYSYDVEMKHLDIAKDNIKRLGIRNITLTNQSLYNRIDVKKADIFCLDLPSPWKALENAKNVLRPGGFVVSYSPTIMQTADFVNAMAGMPEFIHLSTVEVIERQWEVEKRKVRPRSKTIIHSGFITTGRRI